MQTAYYVPDGIVEIDRTPVHDSRSMADDYEDVEQLYLYVNPNLPQVRIPLRDVVDELTRMLREGYIAIKHSNNELVAPLQPAEFTALHHYWFEATDKGTEARKRL